MCNIYFIFLKKLIILTKFEKNSEVVKAEKFELNFGNFIKDGAA
jgi:hypothetical protein